MADFMIRFLICNLFISGIVGLLLITKKLFKNNLTSQMQYHLWFLLLGLLAVPFLPLRPIGFPQLFSQLNIFKTSSMLSTGNMMSAAHVDPFGSLNRINDFAISITGKTPSIMGLALSGIWIVGILAMLLLVIRSRLHLNILKKSALPLQNKEIRILHDKCLHELGIRKDIPIYSTAFLKSPIIAGLFKPCIYLPIHLVSDYCATDMRYILLHELQHYKHKDVCGNYLMSLVGVLYWFNPLVWYALKEMRNDREVACDTSVLELLDETDYEDYGNTLINLAEKVSLTPFPFTSGISGTMKQMQKRIVNIASYKKPSAREKFKDIAAFGMISIILLCSSPLLSTYAADKELYKWDTSSENISKINLSSYFNEYEGCFVLYDLKDDAWTIYNMKHAALRTSPNSTYKIYDALFGLEAGIIAPENSAVAWNKVNYPFEAWNTGQNLDSAMKFSVNWYFQSLDKQLGASAIKNYIQKIGYGNQNTGTDLNTDLATYWLESSLKISPIEQVQLLTKLYSNDFNFAPENVDAVKNSILLSSSANGNLYGKTGTGRINEKDISGWLIGYVETADSTYFFATNIQSTENATGSKASEISLDILSNIGMWKR